MDISIDRRYDRMNFRESGFFDTIDEKQKYQLKFTQKSVTNRTKEDSNIILFVQESQRQSYISNAT